jgi:hypothetical protein
VRVAGAEETPYGQNAPSEDLARLRLRAEELVRTSDDAGLLALLERLRHDDELWPHLWAPACAVAAARTGRADSVLLLEEAITMGFSQPELFEGQVERWFGEDPSWPALRERMATGVEPHLELLDWPDPPPHLPLILDTLPSERRDLLRVRLPARRETAWDTAQTLLRWVNRAWEHANDHVVDPDALEVLDRVSAGQRFACVEYSIVLSQTLNAVSIPARRVALRQANHHVGVGRGHVISEAWLDDLAKWVVLDGQNGSYWADQEGHPLGLLELLDRHSVGSAAARMVGLVDDISVEDAAEWWTYFHAAKTTGYAWGRSFVPIFQSQQLINADRLVHDPLAAYPGLDRVSIGIGGNVNRPQLLLGTLHPYAEAFVVGEAGVRTTVDMGDPVWDLSLRGGVHELSIAVVTPYGSMPAQRLVYRST